MADEKIHRYESRGCILGKETWEPVQQTGILDGSKILNRRGEESVQE